MLGETERERASDESEESEESKGKKRASARLGDARARIQNFQRLEIRITMTGNTTFNNSSRIVCMHTSAKCEGGQ